MTSLDINPDASNQRKASEWLHTLYVINDMLKQVEADGLRINTILPRVLELAMKQLNANDGSIIVVDGNLDIEHVWFYDNRSKQFVNDIMKNGVAGWVIRNKRPVIIDNTLTDDRWLPHPGDFPSSNPNSIICTPFTVRDRSIGAITIHKSGINQFSENDLNLLLTVSSQAATSIENARLYEESQRQLQVFALLNKASQVINSSLDLDQIMQSLLAHMNEFLHAEAISIALVEKKGNELVYKVAEGIGSDKIVNLRLPSNLGISGWVMEHGEPAYVPDTSKDSRFHTLGDQRTGHHSRAMICAPIQFKEEVLGTIQAVNPIKGDFTSEDLDLLVNLANIASSAIANSRQYALTQVAEQRYVNLYQGSVDPIILTDTDGYIVEANNRTFDILGYDEEQLLGTSIYNLHPQNSKFPDLQLIQEDEFHQFTSQLISKNNKIFHVSVFVVRTSFGEIELLQWIHHDISKQVELEEMREDLTAMLFHDLQSPLGNVIASLDLVMEAVTPDMDPSFPIMLDIAMRSSRHLQTLIKSLLDINNLEAGHPISDQTKVEISKLIDEVQEISRPRLEKQEIELIRELEFDIPKIFVEEDMIRRVLVNLVDNALRYSQVSNQITIGAKKSPDENDKVVISVSDHGVGIPKKFRKTIFEKFSRVEIANRSGGIGLGLAFCRLAVEAHGGQIWVEDTSKKGGARFNFTLPTCNTDNIS